jgi:hypothetical protein
MEKKGQGALEYMILIAGAVLVAAIVIAIVTGLTAGGDEAANSRSKDALCAGIPQNECGIDTSAVGDPFNGCGGLASANCSPRDPDGSGALTSASCSWNAALSRCTGA